MNGNHGHFESVCALQSKNKRWDPNKHKSFAKCSHNKLLIQWNLSWETTAMRPPVLTDHTILAEGPTFQYNWTCHQRPPVLTDHIFVANGVVFQDGFHCTCILYQSNNFVFMALAINNGRRISSIHLVLNCRLNQLYCKVCTWGKSVIWQ